MSLIDIQIRFSGLSKLKLDVIHFLNKVSRVLTKESKILRHVPLNVTFIFNGIEVI